MIGLAGTRAKIYSLILTKATEGKAICVVMNSTTFFRFACPESAT